MPDRLPSLVLLVGCWVPPALAGWAAAKSAQRGRPRTVLSVFVVVWSAIWFVVNWNAMPPYIPGATLDPRGASLEAVKGLAVFTSAVVLPLSAIACALAFRIRRKALAGLQ